jgi:hypothetical protein
LAGEDQNEDGRSIEHGQSHDWGHLVNAAGLNAGLFEKKMNIIILLLNSIVYFHSLALIKIVK